VLGYVFLLFCVYFYDGPNGFGIVILQGLGDRAKNNFQACCHSPYVQWNVEQLVILPQLSL